MYKLSAPLLISILLATGAQAKEDKIKDIKVEMDLAAIVNPLAAERLGTLATDLQGAIAARLADRVAEEGKVLTVDISEAELSNAFTDAAGLAETKLVGLVHVTDENDNSNFNSYQLTVTVDQARAFFPADTDEASLTASSDAYYTSLITAFADAVAVRIDE
ncbi:hypothetical protein [Tabrizicola sp.]|uniref:hypothetical protein n=1 Tax=Tabrizicola sp. TaxID=2005166 RepID=UPI00261105A6|nr:hypothetical protein [Tabrizicola sp.]MDM7931091.1 hypothetical protein [Tabrizicola sp.]